MMLVKVTYQAGEVGSPVTPIKEAMMNRVVPPKSDTPDRVGDGQARRPDGAGQRLGDRRERGRAADRGHARQESRRDEERHGERRFGELEEQRPGRDRDDDAGPGVDILGLGSHGSSPLLQEDAFFTRQAESARIYHMVGNVVVLTIQIVERARMMFTAS